ncbi:MAG: sugar phosphate isomerase, partial [Burkholderiaceae bacterium]|nr:sugar phosphate isomerase [Burkholderiaceae bacterium]
MKLGRGQHLGYCTNIHPGETWAQVRASLQAHVPLIRARVCPGQPFGIGLRLSAQAAQTLAEPAQLAEFRQFLRAHDLYVFTLNGFPYGTFHGTTVKEAVYRPDWRTPERLRYSNTLADLLAQLLPGEAGLQGSVSTVPGAFKADIATA